jgi:stress-induced morphogen
MPVLIPRGPQPAADPIFAAIVGAMGRYAADHPRAVVEAYRHGEYAVRIRVTSPDFARRSRTDRHTEVWAYLEPLSEEELGDLHILVCVTPEEKARSIASIDFDDPIPFDDPFRLRDDGSRADAVPAPSQP